MGSRILVVEDSAVIRRLIEVCLRAADLEIITREDGKNGLLAVSSESPDLVVLDIGLPGIDGWEVLDRIRGDEITEKRSRCGPHSSCRRGVTETGERGWRRCVRDQAVPAKRFPCHGAGPARVRESGRPH